MAWESLPCDHSQTLDVKKKMMAGGFIWHSECQFFFFFFFFAWTDNKIELLNLKLEYRVLMLAGNVICEMLELLISVELASENWAAQMMYVVCFHLDTGHMSVLCQIREWYIVTGQKLGVYIIISKLLCFLAPILMVFNIQNRLGVISECLVLWT